jgi:hypothetical protein
MDWNRKTEKLKKLKRGTRLRQGYSGSIRERAARQEAEKEVVIGQYLLVIGFV